ncbi:hypothetical protein BRO13_17365, partial [Xanthomonas oryzae pv. oryzae]
NMVLSAPLHTARPAATCPVATPIASGKTTAAVLRSATRKGTSRGLRSISARSMALVSTHACGKPAARDRMPWRCQSSTAA